MKLTRPVCDETQSEGAEQLDVASNGGAGRLLPCAASVGRSAALPPANGGIQASAGSGSGVGRAHAGG